MQRTITGFHQDDEGHWVAELACLHGQHVRHQPPFFDRPWTQTAEGRRARIGTDLDCPLCDRTELPAGLVLARTAGPWDQGSLPAALLGDHRVARSTWGLLRVLEGAVRFDVATEPPLSRRVAAGDRQPIPPEVAHHLTLDGPVRLAVDFLVAAQPAG